MFIYSENVLNVGNNRKDHRIRYPDRQDKIAGICTTHSGIHRSIQRDSYMVNQEINRKKHPIGSEYKLLYSREKRTAYEKKSNKVYREMEVCFFGLAVLIFIAGIVKLAMKGL